MVRSHPRGLLAGVALAGLVALVVVVLATVVPDTLRAASAQLLSAREQASLLAGEIAGLDGRINGAAQRLTRATDALHDVRRSMRENRRLKDAGARELNTARATLAERAVALYKHDDITTLEALLSADDFAAMIGQLSMVRQVARADKAMLRGVEAAQRRLELRARSLAADERRARRLVGRRDEELASIRAQLGERQALLDTTRADIRKLVAQQTPAAPAPSPSPEQTAAPSDGGGGGDAAGGGSGPWWSLIQQAAAVNGVSARGMYRLMTIESGGDASIVGPGGYFGLFQYAPATWKGSWNPYRAHSITDGAAQIRATALALKLGYGHSWWDPSYSWAFGGG